MAGEPSGPRSEELAQLFRQHNRRLVAYLARRLGNETEAQEVAQEAYARLLQLDRRVSSFLVASLYRVAANLAVDRLRRHAVATRLAERAGGQDLADWLSPDRRTAAADELETLRRALLELPPRHRSAFVLHKFHDRDVDAIGEVLGRKGTQVRLYLRQAMAYCRLRLNGVSGPQAREQVLK